MLNAVLDVTFYMDFPNARELRKKSSVEILNAPRLLGEGVETHALEVDFSIELERNIRIGSQVSVCGSGEMLNVQLIAFEDDFAIGRTFGWVPLKRTISLAISNAEGKGTLECCLTYQENGVLSE